MMNIDSADAGRSLAGDNPIVSASSLQFDASPDSSEGKKDSPMSDLITSDSHDADEFVPILPTDVVDIAWHSCGMYLRSVAKQNGKFKAKCTRCAEIMPGRIYRLIRHVESECRAQLPGIREKYMGDLVGSGKDYGKRGGRIIDNAKRRFGEPTTPARSGVQYHYQTHSAKQPSAQLVGGHHSQDSLTAMAQYASPSPVVDGSFHHQQALTPLLNQPFDMYILSSSAGNIQSPAQPIHSPPPNDMNLMSASSNSNHNNVNTIGINNPSLTSSVTRKRQRRSSFDGNGGNGSGGTSHDLTAANLALCPPCSPDFRRDYDLVDLSYTLDPTTTIFWPGSEGLQLCMNCYTFETSNASEPPCEYFAGTFSCAEHAGTHVDAPFHFARDGRTVDALPLEDLVGACKVIDISHKLQYRLLHYPATPSSSSATSSADAAISGASHMSEWFTRKTTADAHSGFSATSAASSSSTPSPSTDKATTSTASSAANAAAAPSSASNGRLLGDYSLDVSDVLQFEALYGPIQRGDLIIVHTGWSRFWTQGAGLYLGHDEARMGPFQPELHRLSFPGISRDAAQLLVQRAIVGVGIDTASLDPGNGTQDFLAHRILLGAGIYGIENLTEQVSRVPALGAQLQVLPLKLKGGSGAPARVVAMIPRQLNNASSLSAAQNLNQTPSQLQNGNGSNNSSALSSGSRNNNSGSRNGNAQHSSR